MEMGKKQEETYIGGDNILKSKEEKDLGVRNDTVTGKT